MRRVIASLFSGLLIASLTVIAGPASAAPQGFTEDEFEYGFFYGTFDQSPNVALFAGGRIEQFCVGDPGTAPLRVFLRDNETVDLKVNAKDQPIHLYYTEFNDIPEWLDAICPEIAGGGDAPAPFASGTANLKVRDSYLFEDGPPTRLFNSAMLTMTMLLEMSLLFVTGWVRIRDPSRIVPSDPRGEVGTRD